MTAPGYKILPVDLRRAEEPEYLGLNALRNAIRAEILPEDPPWPCDEDRRRWQAKPALIEIGSWAAWTPSGEALALALAEIFHTGDNPRVVWISIEVHPQARRHGLGREMLHRISEFSRSHSRTLLMTECSERVAAGAAFLSRIGARKGLDEPMNQLQVADLDPDLLRTWQEDGSRLSGEFGLELWDAHYPEDRMPDLVDLMQRVANDQPRDTLEMEDINYSAELMRQFEQEQFAGGDQRWTIIATRLADRRLVGLTEVYWNPNRPGILWQGFTGVMPEVRGRGLGRWLKAEMLTKVLRERPQVRVIRAGNADSNEPMLKINRALGFRRFVAYSTWQVELASIEEYLAAVAR